MHYNRPVLFTVVWVFFLYEWSKITVLKPALIRDMIENAFGTVVKFLVEQFKSQSNCTIVLLNICTFFLNQNDGESII